jgi:rod shape determining protein RodA
MMERRLSRERGMTLTEKLGSVSWTFVLLLGLMAGVGYAMLYSAAGLNPEPWAFRHGLRFGFGVLLMIGIAMVDIRIILRLAWPLYLVGVGLLVLVALHGQVGKGAQRWLDLGGFQLQPSELMKILLVIALARWFHRASLERVGNPLFLIPPLIAIAIPVGLVLKQPNLGNAVITLVVGGAVFFAAGVRWWKFVGVIGVAVVAAPIVYDRLHDYQRQRILTFLDPESDPLGAGYHVIQSKIALGSGGMFGRGFGEGTQSQLNFLPEKQTDFIFTMLAEEWGFVGAASVMALILLVMFYGLAIALACRHQFGRLVAAGITVNFALYVFVNIAMVMGMIPVGGVPLPLISHGGSAMITVLIGFGVLMSVHVHRAVEIEGEQADG